MLGGRCCILALLVEGGLAVSRQISVTLADDTAALVEAVPLAERGRFIDAAIRHRASVSRWHDEDLQRRLQEGAIARADRDRDLADEWAALEEEVCPTSET